MPGDRLRIAVTVDPFIPVPPKLYGGIERGVDFLVRELTARGHQVTLFAHPESDTPAQLVPYGSPPHGSRKSRLVELWQLGRALWRRRRDFDVVHSFGRLAALLPILPLRRIAKIQSYQRDGVPWRSVRTAVRLAGDSVRFTGCSKSVFRQRKEGDAGAGHWEAIPNGVELALYDARTTVDADASLAFLGRLERIKGVHSAIAIAKKSGSRLTIAGNRVEDSTDPRYFETEIEPHLDGERIRYIGPVDDVAKNLLLGESAALLMPIEWEEPFGIVMAEALACGTPVVAFSRGSVPDVVRNGLNGFACSNVDEAVRAVGRLNEMDRAVVREDCERRFAHAVIVDQYEELYRAMVGGAPGAAPLPSIPSPPGPIPSPLVGEGKRPQGRAGER